MKLLIRKDPIAFYNHIYHQNEYDLRYIHDNAEDYHEAGAYALGTDPAQLFYDAIMLLDHDPLLRDNYFSDVPGTIFIGQKSSEYWRTQMRLEAERLRLPIVEAPKGDLFCAYTSPETLLSAIVLNTELSAYAIA